MATGLGLNSTGVSTSAPMAAPMEPEPQWHVTDVVSQ